MDHTDVTSWLSYADVSNMRVSAITIAVSTDLVHVRLVNLFFFSSFNVQSNPLITTSVDTTPRI